MNNEVNTNTVKLETLADRVRAVNWKTVVASIVQKTIALTDTTFQKSNSENAFVISEWRNISQALVASVIFGAASVSAFDINPTAVDQATAIRSGSQLTRSIERTVFSNDKFSQERGSSPTSSPTQSTGDTRAVSRTDYCYSAARQGAAKSMLNSIYELESAGNGRKAMLEVFRVVDNAMESDDRLLCDQILKLVDVSRLSADTLVSLLSSTYPARSSLPSRPFLYEKAFDRLTTILGEGEAHEVADRMR